MKRSKSAGWRPGRVAAAAAMLLSLTGCADDPTGPTGEYDELCVDEQTQERVPDDWCDDGPNHHGGHSFVYIPYHYGQPHSAYPVGSKVTGASSVKPASGSFVRGGFGRVRGGASGG